MAGAPSALGFACFAAVKFTGYTAASWALNRSFQSTEKSIWAVGAARTLLGLAAGAAYGGLFILLMKATNDLGPYNDAVTILFFAGLVPVRLAEWSLLIWYFYQRGKPNRSVLLRDSTIGMVWSFVLDAVGVAAVFVVPGGAWIC